MEAINDFVCLKSLPTTWSDERVLELYRSGRIPYYLDDEEEETVTLMVQKAIGLTLRCRDFVRNKDEALVRNHYIRLFAGKEREDALKAMRNRASRKKFIAMQTGRLLGMDIIFAKPIQLAKALHFSNIDVDTVRHYINRGKILQRNLEESK